MARTMISPSKFVLGKGELDNLDTYLKVFGTNAGLISTDGTNNRLISSLEKIQSKNINLSKFGCNGECSRIEINRLVALAKENNSDVIIGLGGGKIIDTAKAVAFEANKPVIIIPTIASTDAPTSALSVIYTEDGVFEEYLFLPQSPNVVLIDSNIIANAPVEYLIAGMGDALATYFEARACERSNSNNFCGGTRTKAILTLSEVCFKTLLEDSVQAIASCKTQSVTPALENIIEANSLLSGLGFESGGLAAAHAIHNGFTVIKETHKANHGEKVAFGVIVQLILENAEELETVISYCKTVGLPTTLRELGIESITDEKLLEVAEIACSENDTMGCMPFKVTPSDIVSAIKTADQIGKSF